MDLDNMSLSELRALKTRVERAIDGYQERQRKEALAAAEEAARNYGFNLSDLTGARKSRRASGTVAPKYQNPDDASQTWTGRGRKPRWVDAALKSGKSLDDLAI